MSIELKQYQEAEGLSDEAMAALLSEKLGRNIGVAGYKIMRGRRDTPNEWHAVLGIAPREPAHAATSDRVAPSGEPRDGEPAPARKTTPDALLPFEPHTAHAAIVLIYTMAGKGAAAVMQAPPVAEVWGGFAPHIATAYIEWAKENETVAKLVAMVTLGGAGGKVMMLHASLLVQTLIVTDKLKADMLVPPELRPDGDPTSVDEGFYPGGENGGEPRPKRTRKRPTPSDE